MRRREFLAGAAGAVATASMIGGLSRSDAQEPPVACPDCATTYESPAAAMKAPRETLAYVTTTAVGVADRPDYLAVVDLDPASKTYSQVVHRLSMPSAGDELHHFGWNACSSCHAEAAKTGEHLRRYLILPGLRSSRIVIADALDPRRPKQHKVIEAAEIFEKTNLSAPHTVHCLPDGNVMISMLGDKDNGAPGGFLLLDDKFDVVGRWEAKPGELRYNYDFWYQPRFNAMFSSEWAAPKTFRAGFDLDDVKAGRYGNRLYVWDWQQRKLRQTLDLGETGMIPLEIRCHHNPASAHGFVGAALSSTMWHFAAQDDKWSAEKVIAVDPVETKGWPFPVPGLITDLVLSMDDRFLYFSNWLHGDIRQYDVSDPAHPRLVGQVWLGGVIGKGEKVGGRKLDGGPQMLQLSLDGKRLYVTNSLFSSWDDQFYPGIKQQGSYMLQLDCNTETGGLAVNEKFFVDFGDEPAGPTRAHEVRFPGGDSTSDIWV
jgi:selenium-binding protein 1